MHLKEKLPFMKAKCRASENAIKIVSDYLEANFEEVSDVYDRKLYFICEEPFVSMGNSIEIEKIEEFGNVVEVKRCEFAFYLFVRQERKILNDGGIFTCEGEIAQTHRSLNEVITQKGNKNDVLPPLQEFIVSMGISTIMA